MDRCSASTLRRVAHTFGIDRKKVRNMLQVGRGQYGGLEVGLVT